jgi:hypothetical protein
MQYYAIQHKKTGRYIAGTDFSRNAKKPRQILSNSLLPPKLFNGEGLQTEIKCRHINLKYYRVVVVEVRKAVV